MGTRERRHSLRHAATVEVAREFADFDRVVLGIDPDVTVVRAPQSPRGYAWYNLFTDHADPLASEAAITFVLQQLRSLAEAGCLPSFRVIVGGYHPHPDEGTTTEPFHQSLPQ